MAPSAGLGLKPEHFDAALGCAADGLWFEVHPENYMAAGGPRPAWLRAIRSRHPVALHGVGLSLAADADPDPAHLERLAALARQIEPMLVSEHLAWSSWRGAYLPDLLPFPRTRAALARIVGNVGRVQDRLGRRISIENPSHYLRIDGHEFDEIAFLAELARRSGCGVLLDVNNVFVSATNHGWDARAYLAAIPVERVGQLHLAGHSRRDRWLVDTHDHAVCPEVWTLYAEACARFPGVATMIERDDHLPPLAELIAELDVARATAAEVRGG